MPPRDPMILWWIAGYFTVIVLLSRVFSRKIADLKDYFLAGRSLVAWPVALTFAASWFGAGSTIASLNVFNQNGLSGLWELAIPSIITCLLITFFMARRVARTQTLSQPEAVEKHYGRAGRFLLSVVILCAVTTFLGSQLVAAGKIYETALGVDITTSTLLITAVVVFYAMLGGYFAVVVTDIAQMALIAAGLLVLLLFCSDRLMTHPDFLGHVLASRHADFWNPGHNLVHHVFLVATFVMGWVIAPEMWQRMSSTRDEHLAFRAAAGASMILVTLFVMVLAIGILSAGFMAPSDRVLVDLAFMLDNPFLTALVIAGVTAAISSTMDSSINVGSLTLTRDLYQGFFRPQATTTELLWVSRAGTALVALPAIGIALYFQDIIRILWISADIYASTMFVPVVGLLYIRQPGRWSGVLAMLFGGLTVLVSALNQYGLIEMPGFWPQWPYSTVVGVGMSAIGFGLGYWLSRKAPSSWGQPDILPAGTAAK